MKTVTSLDVAASGAAVAREMAAAFDLYQRLPHERAALAASVEALKRHLDAICDKFLEKADNEQ